MPGAYRGGVLFREMLHQVVPVMHSIMGCASCTTPSLAAASALRPLGRKAMGRRRTSTCYYPSAFDRVPMRPSQAFIALATRTDLRSPFRVLEGKGAVITGGTVTSATRSRPGSPRPWRRHPGPSRSGPDPRARVSRSGSAGRTAQQWFAFGIGGCTFLHRMGHRPGERRRGDARHRR